MKVLDADKLLEHIKDWEENWKNCDQSEQKVWTLNAISYMKNLINVMADKESDEK